MFIFVYKFTHILSAGSELVERLYKSGQVTWKSVAKGYMLYLAFPLQDDIYCFMSTSMDTKETRGNTNLPYLYRNSYTIHRILIVILGAWTQLKKHIVIFVINKIKYLLIESVEPETVWLNRSETNRIMLFIL